jgi:hypothetical protein
MRFRMLITTILSHFHRTKIRIIFTSKLEGIKKTHYLQAENNEFL